MNRPHILAVEDDAEISGLVARYLAQNSMTVSVAHNGSDMDRLLHREAIDLVLLDINLPREDGFSICRRLRSTSELPIIMVSARGEDIDRILGLEMGADDYLAKPFNPRELLARIRAVLRRHGGPPLADEADAFLFRGWRLDAGLRQLFSPEGVKVALTGAEFDLLQAFCLQPGRVLSREALLDVTLGSPAGSAGRSIDVLISRLRHKIEREPREPEMIRTIRSCGYLFTGTVERG